MVTHWAQLEESYKLTLAEFLPSCHPVLLHACGEKTETLCKNQPSNKQKNLTICITQKGQKLHMIILGEQEAFYFPIVVERRMQTPTKTTNFLHTEKKNHFQSSDWF